MNFSEDKWTNVYSPQMASTIETTSEAVAWLNQCLTGRAGGYAAVAVFLPAPAISCQLLGKDGSL